MKKKLKIVGITLASLVGVILVIVLIALGTLTSPKRLTRLVQKHLPEVVDYDIRFHQAKLTLVKTFPEIGLEIDQVALLSPMESAPSDTLASIEKLVVSADAKKFLKEKAIVVKSLQLDHANVNLFTDTEGHSNLDIFKSDSTAKDTTPVSFDYAVDLNKLELNKAQVLYTDLSAGMEAQVNGLDMDIKGQLSQKNGSVSLSMTSKEIHFVQSNSSLDLKATPLDIELDGTLEDFNKIGAQVNVSSDDLSMFAGYPVLDHDRVALNLPLDLVLDPFEGTLGKAQIGLNDYLIDLSGVLRSACEDKTLVDLDFNTNTLDIEDVLSYLPKTVIESFGGIRFEGKIALSEGHINGVYSDTEMPVITAQVTATEATVDIPQLPYPFTNTTLNTLFSLDLNDSINARNIDLSTRWGHSPIRLSGSVTDISKRMFFDSKLSSDFHLADVKPFLPDEMSLQGQTDVKLNLKGSLDDLLRTVTDYNFSTRLRTHADLAIRDFSFGMDSIQAASEQLALQLTLPGALVQLNSAHLDASVGQDINATVNNIGLQAKAQKITDLDADFTLNQAEITLDGLKETVIVPAIDFSFNGDRLDFKEGGIRLGSSDIGLKGEVSGLKAWLESHENLLKAQLSVNSNRLDVNEIMELTSGLGRQPDSTETVRADKPDEDNPFMVPEGVDFSLDITANKALYGNFEFNKLGGNATVKDGTLMLREIGFTNEAARMELTAMYQSPRKNHLFVGMDFHLIDVQIYDLLHMIPEIDTIVPMLKTFDGAAEFHIAAQTYLKSNYDLKMSTLRAAADVEGANLKVKDIASFTKITDLLDISTNGEYKIDSIDIQMTAFKDEVDLWPFQISIGKYKATLDGHYKLNKNGEYHISVTESPLPTRLGLKISGPLNNLSYTLEPCKYPHLYKPTRRSDTEQLVIDLKKKIADELKANVTRP